MSCESILLHSHWVLVIMDQSTRRIIGFGVHAGDVDGRTLCCMFNAAISKKRLPHYLSSDNDPLFYYHPWQANLRILGVDEIKSVPCTPTSYPFIERLIGNHVVERYVVNTLIVSFFGMLAISSENSKSSHNITTNIEFINHWQEKHWQLLVVTFNLNPQSSITIRGSHIATDCIKHKSLLKFGIRLAHL